MSEETPRATENRSTTPGSDLFRQFISENWADSEQQLPAVHPAAELAKRRRARIAADFPGKLLIIPAGAPKVRSNDTDYPYRAHSAFSHLTAWGSESEPDSVLVLDYRNGQYLEYLYFRERAGRESDEFYANPQIGEFWIGARPSLEQVSTYLGIKCLPIQDFFMLLSAVDENTVLLIDGDAAITQRVQTAREALDISDAVRGTLGEQDALLERNVSEIRLVKDEWEINELRLAIDATHRGFTDIIQQMEEIAAHERGERLIEGIFYTRARSEGNAVGYDTIAASGKNACILHWTRNTGKVQQGDLVLIDAGIEMESLYTADITRTLPISGTFSPTQRLVYEAVREAADAAFSMVKPGIRFRDIHETAMKVIAAKTAEWGFLPVSAEESLQANHQFHRRYMVHGTSHHLGLDVHDCAQARRELYLDGILEQGMVFTIEPGLYFQADDLSVPEEFRGIGVRIEDNILVTADGAENMSIAIPRTADDVEQWMSEKW